ncbi:hypothetical protein N8703_03565 [Verrucomicrobia bacterium]|nr:hypothetical protein [Verrucomicrobiota bacterium]
MDQKLHIHLSISSPDGMEFKKPRPGSGVDLKGYHPNTRSFSQQLERRTPEGTIPQARCVDRRAMATKNDQPCS